MAIYHFSAQIISRGKGQSAVASAAYRSGEKLMDERTGEQKFYKRTVQPETMILAPSHAPEWVYDRERLWNEVEKIEKNKNSQLSREINVALPVELSKDQQQELIKDYVQEQFVHRGMVADIAIHRDDLNNPHAHIMLTIRQFNEDGTWGNKKKKEYELDHEGNKVLDQKGKPKYQTISLTDWDKKETLEQWRKEWADHANKALEKEGIKERISHLSHEALGLEQLPTVHLGHVAHDMEKRGVQTDRGNMNRERQEYNALVVDLQKYREEKKALEQEKARQQEQKQQIERFYTPSERVDLQNASKLLKTESSLSNIQKRYEQLDKWQEKINKGDQYLRWKDEKVREASDHFDWINSYEQQIQKAEKRIEDINWFNPLKIKENRSVKEAAEQDISKAKSEIERRNEKLHYHRNKLGFSDEKEFNQIKNQHEADLPGLLEKHRNLHQRIHHERDVLQTAEKAHRNAFVRQTAFLYPERPEMRYMSFQTAVDLAGINKKNGKVVPIEDIEKTLDIKKQEIQRLRKEISRVHDTQLRLQRAKEYLEDYEKYQTIVQKFENNPLLKGKMLVSKSTKRGYESAVTARDSHQSLMKKEGISGRADFEKQAAALHTMESNIPKFKEQIQSQEKGFSFFQAVMNGINQASREMEREQEQRQRLRQQAKAKGKRRQQSLERDDYER